MLIFDIELLSITKSIPAPKDVAAPPADAQRTASGISYKVLNAGSGDRPTAADRVTAHYTGWLADGTMFDSSVQRGAPVTFGVKQVIPGWVEALQLMQVGEKSLFWIPEELTYKGSAGAPPGMLVFEIHLLEIEK